MARLLMYPVIFVKALVGSVALLTAAIVVVGLFVIDHKPASKQP
ncbi:hypothetical protein [Adhaeribacter aquaticus]|nr:hypothetical protein [Adhaeribacter aquaticus]